MSSIKRILRSYPWKNYTGIQKINFFWVVSDLWIDFECFEAAELKMNSVSLYHVKIFCNIRISVQQWQKMLSKYCSYPLEMIVTAMKILLTLSTPCHVPDRAVFYADRCTTFRNVVQFLAQIAKRRSRMSNCTWRTCAADNRGDQRDSTRLTLCRWVLTSCSS